MFTENIQLVQFLIIISLMIISFIFEIVAMEVTALGALGLLLVFNIISIDDAISGYEQSLKTDIIMYSYLLPNLTSYNQSKFVNELLTYFKTLDAIISESK